MGQLTGDPGVYYLGMADVPLASSVYSNPSISGAVCRFRWSTTEPSPGTYNWSFIDGEISKAALAGKKISLQPLGTPAWLSDSLGAPLYYYIDKNPLHSTYGQVVSGLLTWDSVYISRLRVFMQQLAARYSADTNVSYVNFIAVHVTRNIPDSVLTDTVLMTKQPIWLAFNYDADTLAALMDDLIDEYMTLFPNTPLWCSVDYVRFEMSASGRPINYLASQYANYGVTHYPDRFGLFREDLSGCNPPASVNTGSHWYIMQQHPCNTGAQMLWSVQDGPTRMNQCGMVPNTKSFVLDSAVQHGISLGMSYLEIYGADIDDTSLTTSIATANAGLTAMAAQCMATGTGQPAKSLITLYPNPAEHTLFVQCPGYFIVEIFNLPGMRLVRQEGWNKSEISLNFAPGFYLARVYDGNQFSTHRLVIE